MKRYLFIVALLFTSCEEELIPVVVIGKDISSSRYGTPYHHIYFEEGEKEVSGSEYYSTNVGDTIYVTRTNIR